MNSIQILHLINQHSLSKNKSAVFIEESKLHKVSVKERDSQISYSSLHLWRILCPSPFSSTTMYFFSGLIEWKMENDGAVSNVFE